jgi:hypothetical protein
MTMRTTNLKRIAVAGAFTGALSLAAVGLGAGAANADEGDIPFVPGGLDDVQSVLPLIETLGGIGDLGGVGDLGSLTDLGNLANLGDLGNLGGGGLEGLLGLAGGF